MEDITIIDDVAQTETTLILNKDDDVIGVETYFLHPRRVSSFFNRNVVNQRPPVSQPKKLATQIERSVLPEFNDFGGSPELLNSSDGYKPNVRFEVQPCGGPRQRPCK